MPPPSIWAQALLSVLLRGNKTLNSVTRILSTYPSLTHTFMGCMSHRPILCVLLRPELSRFPLCPVFFQWVSWVSNVLYVHPHNVPLCPLCAVAVFCLSLKPQETESPWDCWLPLGFNVIPSWPLLVFSPIFASYHCCRILCPLPPRWRWPLYLGAACGSR